MSDVIEQVETGRLRVLTTHSNTENTPLPAGYKYLGVEGQIVLTTIRQRPIVLFRSAGSFGRFTAFIHRPSLTNIALLGNFGCDEILNLPDPDWAYCISYGF
ncbi:MAG: hypothetical protein ACPG8W_07740 [Candidatus Promineifilaceae bacterium]